MDGIVGEMDMSVFEIIEVEVIGRGSEVSLLVEIEFESLIDIDNEHICSDIEFSALV